MEKSKRVADKIKSETNSECILKEHQIDGLKFMINSFDANRGCILADEMGLGKTCQAVSFLVHLSTVFNKREHYLVMCPLSVLQHWKKEIDRFGCGLNAVVYQGIKEERVDLRANITKDKQWEVILTTYEMALKDKEFFEKWTWQAIIVDEAHRLKNSESLLHQCLRELKVKHFLLLTGTPIQNNMDELYSLLSLIDTEKFPDSKRAKFLQTYSNSKNTKSFDELKELLEKYMIRRTKDIVCPDLPEKSEIVLFHGLSDMQKTLYKALLAKNREIFNQNVRSKQKLMNTLMQLRKCVNHPYLFDGMEPEPFEEGDHIIKNCGKMIILDCLLNYLFKHKHKVLIFSQMTRMLDVLQDYLSYKGYSYERLDGSVRGEERFAAINRFTTNAGTFCFLLSTKAGGLGLTLTAADTVVFIDSDFNPQNDLQAAARAHRIGQDKPVKIIRLVARHTVEEYILKRAGQKMQLTNAILKDDNDENVEQLTAAEISEMLMFGLSQLGETTGGEEKLNDTEITKLIGESTNGRWDPTVKLVKNPSKLDEADMDLYDFQGKNYRKQKEKDERALSDILGVDDVGNDRETKGKRADLVYIPLGRPKPPPKILTPEELEQRRKRREELAEQRKIRENENRKKKEEYARLQKQKVFDRYNYVSTNLPEVENEKNDKDDDESDEIVLPDDDNETAANNIDPIYVVGDVAHPKIRTEHDKLDAVVVHCVDNSGSWGKGGVFDSLAKRSPQIVDSYKKCGKVDDLEMGDVHLFPIDDVISRKNGKDFAALVVAQHYKNRNDLKYSALESALKRLGEYASKHNCTVHLPRIGYGLAKFNWYGTERMIRKFLCRRNIPTYIYYFSRRTTKERLRRDASTDLEDSLSSNEAEKCDDEVSKPKKIRLDYDATDLPTIFDGLLFCFVDLAEDVAKRLGRFVIAYDGQWTSDKNAAGITHVVVENESDEIKETPNEKKFTVVNRDWLEKCLKQKKLLPLP